MFACASCLCICVFVVKSKRETGAMVQVVSFGWMWVHTVGVFSSYARAQIMCGVFRLCTCKEGMNKKNNGYSALFDMSERFEDHNRCKNYFGENCQKKFIQASQYFKQGRVSHVRQCLSIFEFRCA